MENKLPYSDTTSLQYRDDPNYWHSHKTVKWYDDEGKWHKTYVTPIEKLRTGHLYHIIANPKYDLKSIEGKPIWYQVMNVIQEYKWRLQNGE